MWLQYFLIISPVYSILDRRNPDSWNANEHSSPLEREDWRNAFETGFSRFCKRRGTAGDLKYDGSMKLFNLLKRHVGGYSNTTEFRGYYYRVGLGYNPLNHLDFYPMAFAAHISRHTYKGEKETCQMFREYPHFQCDMFRWTLSLYIYCVFAHEK
ncbi:unnamed protein product [Cylicocyclus nassatus]|uniref:Uncharacterized protein n=1 Tax=Cylicocyclus nassatus TaxID=53992 RepID=A0AA36DRX2_CYLNA|nr:unnamed protein product [Cylicocyclus nassatus]